MSDTENRHNAVQVEKLAAALAKAQGQITNAAKSRVAEVRSAKGNFDFGYSTLSDVWDVIRKPLSENEIAVVQVPEIPLSGEEVVVTTMLLHSSGQQLSCGVRIKVGEKRDAQSIGVAIAYGRRYGLCALTGVASEEGNESRQRDQRPVQQPPRPSPAPAAAAENPIEKDFVARVLSARDEKQLTDLLAEIALSKNLNRFESANLVKRCNARLKGLQSAKAVATPANVATIPPSGPKGAA